jgi:8-oxo-dGTP pyrophosphatase MutT (NUDIX family)
MTLVEQAKRPVVLKPRDAATLIIIDGSRRRPRVLMGRRHTRQVFMGDMFVFPGGRYEPDDRRMSAAGALHQTVEARLLERCRGPAPDRPRALALTAVRETFEETGLVIGTKDYGTPENVPPSWSEFARQEAFPELDGLHFVARAITPPGRSRRFDTRFFAVSAKAIVGECPGFVGPDSEFVEIAWVSFAEAERLPLPDITRIILAELERRLEAGLAYGAPVPFFYMSRGKPRRDELTALSPDAFLMDRRAADEGLASSERQV